MIFDKVNGVVRKNKKVTSVKEKILIFGQKVIDRKLKSEKCDEKTKKPRPKNSLRLIKIATIIKIMITKRNLDLLKMLALYFENVVVIINS